MAAINTCVITKELAITLRISRLLGVAPFHFLTRGTKTVATFSRSLHIYGIIITVFSSFIFIHEVFFKSTPLPILRINDKAGKIWNFSQILGVGCRVISISVIFSSVFYVASKITRYLHYTTEVNKIKNALNCQCRITLKHRCAVCLVAILLYVMSIPGWISVWKDLSLLMYTAATFQLYSALFMMEVNFVLVAFEINTAIQAINKCLNDVLALINNERSSCNTTSLSGTAISYEYVPVTSINKTIDLVGNLKQDSKMARRMKLARKIRDLSDYYGRTCKLWQELNEIESMSLFLHIFGITMILVSNLNNLVEVECTLDSAQYQCDRVLVHCLNCVPNYMRAVLLTEPCYCIKEEVAQTKILVAYIMNDVTCKDDPLNTAVNAFYQQLLLKDVSFNLLGILTLDRPMLFTMIGGAITLYVILSEI